MQQIRQAAGSLLVAGLTGAQLSADERSWLKEIRPAGIILFRRNITDAKQTRALLREATRFCDNGAARFVDLEGGTVDRLRDALAPMPSAQAVAVAARKQKKPALARQHGEMIARAVSAFGFNTTLAPVVDLGLPESASVMGTRTAGATAAEVIAYARGFFSGLKAHGVAGCAKHFPGLGGGTLDSHLATPAIERTLQQLWRDDLEPYGALHRQMPFVMINHATYPATQSKDRPASVSRYWIETILRKRIGYRGLVLSDDLEMGGILNVMPMEEAAVEAIRAGSDLIEICHRADLIHRAYEALIAEAERSLVFRRLLLDRARQSARKRIRLFAGHKDSALTETRLAGLRNTILRFAEAVQLEE